MTPSAGLITALNKMREMSVQEGSVYHQYVPVVDENTDIAKFGQPILDSNLTPVYNDFFHLLKRIAFFAIEQKRFKNPLSFLEGDNLPLGYAGQNVHVNPVKGRAFNVNDFAGLLQKYEAEVFTEYLNVNLDKQYPLSYTRAKVKNAFTSWADLEAFINGLINALYNAAEIDAYCYTKDLVTAAYYGGRIVTDVIENPDDATSDKAFVKTLRKYNRLFQLPSSSYNAWKLVNGDEAKAITTWSDAGDIGVMIAADVEAEIDVEVLAAAFNMDKADFLGRLIVVDNFDVYDDEGNKVKDGSAIKAVIFDKSFFKIKTQDYAMDEFYNPNNRTWTAYLNVNKMYNTSLFANAICLATEAAPSQSSQIEADPTSVTLDLAQEPISGTTTITKSADLADVDLEVSTSADVIIASINQTTGVITFSTDVTTPAGDYVATVSCGEADPIDITVKVTAPSIESLRYSGSGTTIKMTALNRAVNATIIRDPNKSQGGNMICTLSGYDENFAIEKVEDNAFNARYLYYYDKFSIKQISATQATQDIGITFSIGDITLPLNLHPYN